MPYKDQENAKQKSRERYEKNKKKILDQQKKRIRNMSAEEYDEFRKKCRKSHNKHYQKNKKNINEKRRQNYKEIKLKQYNLSPSEYDDLLNKQNNNCAICGKRNESNAKSELFPLCVDHCHETSKVRGLLCHNCNVLLGMSNDNINVLRKAIEYLCQTKN